MTSKNSIFRLGLCLSFMLCSLVWTQTELDKYYAAKKEAIAPINLCFKISSQTDTVSMELLFGTCANAHAEVNTFLPPGTVGGGNPVDFYFLHQAKAWDVFFTENQQPSEWTLVLNTPCILDFTLLGGTEPVTGALEFFFGENKREDIGVGSSFELAAGEYIIKFTPPPEKSEEEAEVTYTFQPGWNLLHLPIVVYEDARRTDDNWDELNDRNDLISLPRMTLVGKTYVNGGEIRCGEAFWVFYQTGTFTDNKLTVLGYEPLATEWSERTAGWNFQGEQSDNTASIIYQWSDKKYQPIQASALSPEQGYWLKR